MVIVNNYSMLWGGILILGLAVFFLLRKGSRSKNGLKLILIAAALFVSWLVLRPDQATISEITQFKGELGQGQAVLLELQSPY